MIKYSALLPTRHLYDFADLVDFDFLEPIPDEAYKNYYHFKAPTAMRLLDNGLIEFGDRMHSELYEYARIVHATHLIPPDKLGDWSFNAHQAEKWMELWPKKHLFIALAGPEYGDFDNQADWCFERGFGGICLPYRLNRVPMHYRESIHLLGLRVPEVWRDYNCAGARLSLDTTEPINAAIYGHSYEQWKGIITLKRHPDYQNIEIGGRGVELARNNIKYMKAKLNES